MKFTHENTTKETKREFANAILAAVDNDNLTVNDATYGDYKGRTCFSIDTTFNRHSEGVYYTVYLHSKRDSTHHVRSEKEFKACVAAIKRNIIKKDKRATAIALRAATNLARTKKLQEVLAPLGIKTGKGEYDYSDHSDFTVESTIGTIKGTINYFVSTSLVFSAGVSITGESLNETTIADFLKKVTIKEKN